MRTGHEFGSRVVGLAVGVVTGCCFQLPAQNVYQVSKNHDSISAPGANSLPGFSGGFKQQILIDKSRLAGLTGKSITGFAVRRDLDELEAMQGGQIDLVVWMSTAIAEPAKATELFAQNAPRATQTRVFSGRIAIPNSPSLAKNPSPWTTNNSVTVPFSSGFVYQGGTLCIELEARPVAGSEPYFWYTDHEHGGGGGRVTPYGQTCSTFRASGFTLFGEASGLQIGSSMRLITIGHPNSNALLLIGASKIPGGIDLSAAGAPGCSQYVSNHLTVGLWYAPKSTNFPFAFANFKLQIPHSQSLLGATVFVQSADLETQSPKTNPAGLTTSNGLELQISSTGPTLGMATVRSHLVEANESMPVSGTVNVEMAPVMRLLYR